MYDFSGKSPDLYAEGGETRLRWKLEGRNVETDFDRFRPIELKLSRDKRLAIKWGDFGDLAMDDHFFKITLERATVVAGAAAPFMTPPKTLRTAQSHQGLLPFSGAIFHMGRAGSTLIHRLLSRTGKVLSLSEVTIFDEAARISKLMESSQGKEFLDDLIRGYRHPRRPNEQHFVVKMTDAMGATHLATMRSTFPSVAWIFVYRDPIEIMVSVLNSPTGNMQRWFENRTNVAERLRMPILNDPGMWPDEFVAQTLRHFCAKAVEAAKATPSGGFLAVSYSRLPEAIWETIAPHFGIELSSRDVDVMRDEAKYSSKSVNRIEFNSDSKTKKDSASQRIASLTKKYADPWIEQLKSLPQD